MDRCKGYVDGKLARQNAFTVPATDGSTAQPGGNVTGMGVSITGISNPGPEYV